MWEEVLGSRKIRRRQNGSTYFTVSCTFYSRWRRLTCEDLAVVAVLGVFSSKHELSSASALPDFVSWVLCFCVADESSYYLLIVWLWTSQVGTGRNPLRLGSLLARHIMMFTIKPKVGDKLMVALSLTLPCVDGWHRLTKFLQVILFLYIGAASSQWSLSRLRDYTDTPGIKSTIVSAHRMFVKYALITCLCP